MSFNQEWLILKSSTPKEIVRFINEVFEVIEIRRRLGEEKGIKFIVHSNESNHTVPHIHAEYGEFNVSITIDDQKVLAGNLPNHKLKAAQDWVRVHKHSLIREWNDYVLSATTHTTRSKLSGK